MEQLIIIGAHYDIVYMGPGAVDDTSGTVIVLEMAR
jgi:Zn-dependent M28 family amino/carboxypeptidase